MNDPHSFQSPSGPEKLQQLIESLKPISPKLQEITLANLSPQDMEKLTDARAETLGQFKEAINNNIIRPAQSPAFVKGLRESQIRIDTNNFLSELLNRYLTGEVQNSLALSDGEAFFDTESHEFIQELADTYTAEELVDITIPALEEMKDYLMMLHEEVVNDNIEKQFVENFITEIQQHLNVLNDQNISDTQDGSLVNSIAEQIINLGENALALGLNPTFINEVIIDTVADQVAQTGNTDHFILLEHIIFTHPNAFLAKTQYAKKRQSETLTQLEEKL